MIHQMCVWLDDLRLCSDQKWHEPSIDRSHLIRTKLFLCVILITSAPTHSQLSHRLKPVEKDFSLAINFYRVCSISHPIFFNFSCSQIQIIFKNHKIPYILYSKNQIYAFYSVDLSLLLSPSLPLPSLFLYFRGKEKKTILKS